MSRVKVYIKIKIKKILFFASGWLNTLRRILKALWLFSGAEMQIQSEHEVLYYQLIIKITISEKRKIAKLCDNGKIYIKKLTI